MNHFDFKCAKPGHHSSPILFVCLNPKCKNQRRSCIQCVDQYHLKHDLVSIEKFIKEINSNLQRYNNHPEKHEISNFVDKIRTDFSKTRILQSIERLEVKVNDFLLTIQQSLTANSQSNIRSQILNTFSETQTVIEDYLTLSTRTSKIQLGTFKDIKRNLYDYFYTVEDGSYNFTSELQKKITTLQKRCNVNCLAPKKSQDNFVFSDIHKPLCIQLEDSRRILQQMAASYSHTVCCLDKPFDYSNNSFCVKINKNPKKRIWIGVCSLSLVKKNTFFNCFGVGKGTYALDQTGGYNSFDGSTNYASVSSHHELKSHYVGGVPYLPKWNFKQGDILYVKVDILGSYVSFYLLNQQYDAQGVYPANQVYSQYYSIEMKMPTDDLYGFVGLNGIGGDEVTVLSRKEVNELTAVYGNKWLIMNGEMDEQQVEDEEDFGW